MSPTPHRSPSPLPLRECWLVFAVALALKVLSLVTAHDSPFVTELTNDELHHWNEALGIMSSGVIRPDAFYFAPLYPYLLAALFAVTRPSLTAALIVLPVVALALVVDHLDGRLAATRRLVLWIAGLVIGILPATVHNFVAASDLVLTTYQRDTQFWIGNNPGATYRLLRPDRGLPGQERFDAVSLAESSSGGALFPSQVSSFWFRRGLDFVRSEPGRGSLLWFERRVSSCHQIRSDA